MLHQSLCRFGPPVKCVHTKDKLFSWKIGGKTSGDRSPVVPSPASSTASLLRQASSPSSGPSPPSSPSRSRSPQRSPHGRGHSGSPPRTPRTPRARTPRVQSRSPPWNTPPPGSPRVSRRDTPTRRQRQGQYPCRHCGELLSSVRLRNNHETSSCRNRPQTQV